MSENEIAALRALLASRPPRPASVEGRRERMDALGDVYRVAEDIRLEPVSADGVPAEWSVAPGAEESRVLLYLHGGGFCAGSIISHRAMVTEAGRARRRGLLRSTTGGRRSIRSPRRSTMRFRPIVGCSRGVCSPNG
jgi:monoterpene epsilon-lactone hydrolase